MATADTHDIAHQFLSRFVSVNAEVIRRVVDEARNEAVSDARVIIRKHTLERLLAEISDEAEDAGQASPTQPILASRSDDELGRRAVVELHGMRTQIVRNEELLLNIRPATASVS